MDFLLASKARLNDIMDDPEVVACIRARLTARRMLGAHPSSGIKDPTPEEGRRELGRFLWLKALLGTDIPLPTLTGLDWMWHALILDTRLYAALCERIAGPGAFIHHRSGQFTNDAYVAWLAAYREHFGEPDQNMWPPANVLGFAASAPDHDCA